jgi:hypothetical protein
MPRVGRYLVIKDTETSGKDKDKPNQTSQGRPNTNTTEPPTAPRNAEEPGDPDSDEASKIISKYHRPDSPTSVPSQRTSHGGQREQERRRKREEQRDGRGDNVKFLQWPSYSLTPRGSGHQAKRATQVTREPRFLHGSVTAESRQARSIQLRGLIRVPCTVGAVPKPVGSFQVPSTAGSVNASALSRSTLGSVPEFWGAYTGLRSG